ncbi:MAG: efflux RND transporter permease subunit [Hyphomicrobiaceae bacterium]
MSDAGRSGSSGPIPSGRRSNLITLFASHPTAPNLLMITLLLFGFVALAKLNRQFFPTIDVPAITVSVAWPGASAEDVESNILDVLEPELRFLDDIYEVTSIAREGGATISIEFNSGADLQKAQSDIEQAVGRVTTLPETTERPIVSRVTLFDNVAKIAISGPFTEQVMKTYAKQLRDGLLAAGIDRITLSGARDEEIWISIRDAELRRLGLSLDTVSRIVRENTQDVPAGKLEGDVEVQLRAKAERKTPEAIGEIEIKSAATGERVLLRDIATIDTRFERDGKIGVFKGEPGIELQVQRAITADTLVTMRLMNAYIEKIRPTLPPTWTVGRRIKSHQSWFTRVGLV